MVDNKTDIYIYIYKTRYTRTIVGGQVGERTQLEGTLVGGSESDKFSELVGRTISAVCLLFYNFPQFYLHFGIADTTGRLHHRSLNKTLWD